MPWRVSKSEFDELVERALREVPPPFDRFLEEVTVEVRTRPTAEQRDSTGTRDRGLLLGLYHGHPLTRRNIEAPPQLPDVIYIFQESLEQISDSEAELIEQVRKTVLHEIGHHFGMSEEDLEELGYG